MRDDTLKRLFLGLLCWGFFPKTSRHIGLGVVSWKSTVFSPVAFGRITGVFFHGHWGRKGSDPGGTALYTPLWSALFGNESSISWIKKYQIYAHKDIGVMSGHHSIRVPAFVEFLPQIHCANLCWCWVCERWGRKQSSKEPCECGNTEKLGCGSSSSLVNSLLKFQVTNWGAEYGWAEDEPEFLAESSPDPWRLPVFMNVVS